MRLDEAEKILNDNGYELLDEGKLGRALGIGALALGSLVGNANAISDNDIGKYEKQAEQVQNEKLPTGFEQNKSGDLIRKIDGSDYTKYEILYTDNTAKTITKFRTGNQVICYYENPVIGDWRNEANKIVFINSNNKIEFIIKNGNLIKDDKIEKLNTPIIRLLITKDAVLRKYNNTNYWVIGHKDDVSRYSIDLDKYNTRISTRLNLSK
jgi:hypothetical protein